MGGGRGRLGVGIVCIIHVVVPTMRVLGRLRQRRIVMQLLTCDEEKRELEGERGS